MLKVNFGSWLEAYPLNSTFLEGEKVLAWKYILLQNVASFFR